VGPSTDELTTEDLRADIARRRDDMGDTLEAIGDRVSPNRIVERRKAGVRYRLTSMKESVMGSPDFDTRGRAHDLRDAASEKVSSAGDTAKEKLSDAGDAARDAASKVAEAPEMVRRQTAGNPLAAGIIAFGAGMLAATLIPETEPEHRAVQRVQPRLEEAAREVRGVGEQVAEQAKESAQRAAEDLKETAQDAAQSVKERAQEAGQEVADDAKQGAQAVKDDATAPPPGVPNGHQA